MRHLIKSFIFTMLMATGCGQNQGQNEQLSDAKIVIGDNQLQYYVADDQFSQSIGHMALGCTATHIGQGYVITAGHCVSSSTCSSSSYNVRWGFTFDNRAGNSVSRCESVVARRYDGQLDYAILKYSNPPAAFIPVNRVNRPTSGDRITILSHPSSQPLSWSGWCNHLGNSGASKFLYECDTMPGSSGAAILNANLEVIGIHNFGARGIQKNGGTYLQDIPFFSL